MIGLFIFLTWNLELGAWNSFAANLQSQGFGARHVGLGGIAAVVFSDDAYGMAHNPAGLSLASNPEVVMDYARLLMGLSDESGLEESYAGFVYPWQSSPGAAGAAGLARSFMGVESSAQGAAVDLFSEEIFYASYGESLPSPLFGGHWRWGLTAKWIRRAFGDIETNANALDNNGNATGQVDPVFAGGLSQDAFSFDAGWHWSALSGWSVGFLASNVNEPDLAMADNDSDPLWRGYRAAAAYQVSPLTVFTGGVEMVERLEGLLDHRASLGCERFFPAGSIGIFGVRGSLGAGSRDWAMGAGGFSWKTRALSIDYGYEMSFGSLRSVQGSHRVSLSLRFGEPPAEDDVFELYRQEREARRRLELEIEQGRDLLARLITASEQQAFVPPPAPPAVVVEVVRDTAKEAGERDFEAFWELYQERKKAGAALMERVALLQSKLDLHGRRPAFAQEWQELRSTMDREQKDFEQIWESYKRLASLNAPADTLRQSLNRIVRRFEGSSVNLREVYREMDRLRTN
ncbi:MAG: hypothetical protein HY547_10495 [Elusimicrobia bacterium]|nr:hypothetical protein [Elusimicrobiota bacterium]